MKITVFTLRSLIFKAINLLLCLALIVIGANPVMADVYVKAFLEGADFSGRVLQGYQFNESDLRNTSFVNADAQGVSFFAANMKESNLTGANLSNSTLDNARLDKANLTNVILEGAFAYGTSFNNVIIDGADFTDVDLRPPIRQKLCQLAKGQNPVTGRLTRETLECE
ncbi:MAG: pentapeptide repeat-containing protein [Pseudanabaena frigida]|uniref:Pentapeptide repeat-containing protein n=1 Tax=Pseudanabaena frigida TaxID=945775 RepID=A0A2W4VVX2_9CYAN|nr:MAG: pentapeptide repeat-containing protein [Pseudanabaena frigida]